MYCLLFFHYYSIIGDGRASWHHRWFLFFLYLWRLCSIYELFNYDRCASYDALGAAQLSGSVALLSNL